MMWEMVVISLYKVLFIHMMLFYTINLLVFIIS